MHTPKLMKTRVPGLLLLGCLAFSSAVAETPILSFDDVRSGMRGTGRTVFSGTTIESFDVEVLGKLPNIGPRQNLILARCTGGPLEETGVLAGMSGSPVTVDGKLIGAIAYSWPFTKGAIAGITPIEEMLAVTRLDDAPRATRAVAYDAAGRYLDPLYEADRLAGFFAGLGGELLQGSGAALPFSLPLSVAGVGPQGLARMRPELTRAGFLPLQVGGSGDGSGDAPPLQPGSAVGLKLVRGDVDMTATGTVTWIDGDRVLAFGHPLFGLGSVDLPLTGADVQLLLPSLAQSAKLAVPLGEIGALRQDRSTAVFGLLGARPQMIPVRLQLTGAQGKETAFSFDIADDALLSPLLLYITVNGILAGSERTFGSATLRLREGSVIKMADGEDVNLDNVYAGSTALDYGTGISAYILHLLMNNVWAPPQVAGVNLILDYAEFPRVARIRRVTVDRYTVRPGEIVEATVVVTPYRGLDQTFRSKIEIPAETPPGPLVLYAGGAGAVSRSDRQDGPPLPHDLDQLILLINQLRRNDRIYLVADREDNGVLLDGARLPNLPPSVATVLSRPATRGALIAVPRRRVLEEMIRTDYAVEGSARTQLQVVDR